MSHICTEVYYFLFHVGILILLYYFVVINLLWFISVQSPGLLTHHQNHRRKALALVTPSNHNDPLQRIYPDAVFEQVFQQQSQATHRQQQESPVDEAGEVVEARAPREQRVARPMASVKVEVVSVFLRKCRNVRQQCPI